MMSFFKNFKLPSLSNTSAQDAGIYGSQTRDDYDRDDVEQYFNYMGLLAVDGTYDRMEKLLATNNHPVDVLLLMAAEENDVPKLEELMRAGADRAAVDHLGRTAQQLAKAPAALAAIAGGSRASS